jgi:hypothetical protein
MRRRRPFLRASIAAASIAAAAAMAVAAGRLGVHGGGRVLVVAGLLVGALVLLNLVAPGVGREETVTGFALLVLGIVALPGALRVHLRELDDRPRGIARRVYPRGCLDVRRERRALAGQVVTT